ncbi:MAG: COX15/CtaA family protein [Gemmatimonadota bacterium]|nr:COX15/CtaA family protein [Gemmatimonadota bacterium]MDH3369561.1 COX15/CtaA family protein [Gemmatimonadota bacterium]MDH3479533.1 COX15/CtaA family protein [Gemmatimonadota bacterium]
MKTLRSLAFVTAGFSYAVIVLGFIVRITGSGMGCGDDWPLCNGQLLPSLDSAETVIEFGHRVAVLGLGALAVAVAIVAWQTRKVPGAAGRGGTVSPALLAVGLLVVQSLLGALAVKLELPPHTVVLHLGTGLALLATLVVLGLRAGVLMGTTAPPGSGLPSGGILGAAVLGALVVLMGGMTATTGASSACVGFPLCNGQVWPTGGADGLQHIHWTHRLLAYGLFLHLMGMALGLRRKKAPERLKTAAWVAFGLAVAQVAAGAVMVLAYLPPFWRGLHAVLGTAVWVALVYITWVARGRAPSATPAATGG